MPIPEGQDERTPLTRVAEFDAMFRGEARLQPAGQRLLSSLGVMAAGSGDTASKYVARRETPLYIPENCTQCMECIAVCPDTALPNCSQDLDTILQTAVTNYVTDAGERQKMLQLLPEIEKRTRELMRDAVAKNDQHAAAADIIREVTNEVNGFSPTGEAASSSTSSTRCRWRTRRRTRSSRRRRRRRPGGGGIFSIFVSDLCKGCAACVTACGEHQALRMVQETEEVNAEHESGTAFLDLLPDTSQKYLGLYNDTRPQDSKTATLRNMLMVRRNYDALVSGDGACAGCGEKSILRAIAAVTEAYMRPLYHAKADRFRAKADELEKDGVQKLAALKARSQEEYDLFRQAVAHLLMGLGGEDDKDTKARIAGARPDLRPGHRSTRSRRSCGRRRSTTRTSSRSTAASPTACRSWPWRRTPAATRSTARRRRTTRIPYPWMNSLFQDGITVGWLLGESFIVDHGRRSVIPERLADALMHRETDVINPREYYEYVALQRRGDDRPGDPRAAEGLGGRRRRRHGRHRLPEHVEGDPAEPAERQGASCSTRRSTRTPAARTPTRRRCSAATT